MSLNQTTFSESDASRFQQQLVASRGATLESFKLLKSRWNALKSVWRDHNKQTFEPQIDRLFLQWEKALASLENHELSVDAQIKISESIVDINALLDSLSGGVQSSKNSAVLQQPSTRGQTDVPNTGDHTNSPIDSAVDESQELTSQSLEMMQQSIQMLRAKSATGLEVAAVSLTLFNSLLSPFIFSATPNSIPIPALQPDLSATSNVASVNQCDVNDAPVLPEHSETIKKTTEGLGNLDGYADTKKKPRKDEDDDDSQTIAH